MPVPDWVDAERGLVSRTIFVSDEIQKLEMERIFARSWCFLGHVTEIPQEGDFVTRSLAGAPVILVRGGGDQIHVLLNSCRHRGIQLCRADSGTTPRFLCPYHGWTYERDGALLTTGFDRHFPDGFDLRSLSLVPVPRVTIFTGLIFGCWDPVVAPLRDHLGDFAWYLEALFARTPLGMEVLAPPHRWRAKANWKVGAVNFCGDNQHISTTHIGPLTLDPLREARAGYAKVAGDSFQVVTGGGHGCTLTYLGPGLSDDAYRMRADELVPLYRELLDPQQLDMIGKLRVIVGTVFPNMSFIETQAGPRSKVLIVRLWQPVSGTEMEVFSWVLAEREASADYKAEVLRQGLHNLGAAGLFEQDDLELWTSATFASNNPRTQQLDYSFQTAPRYADAPDADFKWPGRAFRPIDTEVAQLEFLKHWQRVMTAEACKP